MIVEFFDINYNEAKGQLLSESSVLSFRRNKKGSFETEYLNISIIVI